MPSLSKIYNSIKAARGKLHKEKSSAVPNPANAIEEPSLTNEPNKIIPPLFTKPDSEITLSDYRSHTASSNSCRYSESSGRWLVEYNNLAQDSISNGSLGLKRANTITEDKYRYYKHNDAKAELKAPFTLFRGVNINSKAIEKMRDNKSTSTFGSSRSGNTYVSCAANVAVSTYTINKNQDEKDGKEVVFIVPPDYLPVDTYGAPSDLSAFEINIATP